MSRHLQARVDVLNTVYEYTNEMAPQLAEDFRSLLGERLIGTDGYIVPEIEELLKPFHKTPSVQVYPKIYLDSLCLIVEVRLPVKGKRNLFISQSSTVLVGRIEDGILVELPEIETRRIDHTMEDFRDATLNPTT